MQELVKKHKAGQQVGICSVCSAHPPVVEAALRFDLETDNRSAGSTGGAT